VKFKATRRAERLQRGRQGHDYGNPSALKGEKLLVVEIIEKAK
jgi:hypothetical protein